MASPKAKVPSVIASTFHMVTAHVQQWDSLTAGGTTNTIKVQHTLDKLYYIFKPLSGLM